DQGDARIGELALVFQPQLRREPAPCEAPAEVQAQAQVADRAVDVHRLVAQGEERMPGFGVSVELPAGQVEPRVRGELQPAVLQVGANRQRGEPLLAVAAALHFARVPGQPARAVVVELLVTEHAVDEQVLPRVVAGVADEGARAAAQPAAILADAVVVAAIAQARAERERRTEVDVDAHADAVALETDAGAAAAVEAARADHAADPRRARCRRAVGAACIPVAGASAMALRIGSRIVHGGRPAEAAQPLFDPVALGQALPRPHGIRLRALAPGESQAIVEVRTAAIPAAMQLLQSLVEIAYLRLAETACRFDLSVEQPAHLRIPGRIRARPHLEGDRRLR